ncbi:MAG TPA: YoaK family protein [Acidimicrobiales bacterium]|nr:YoaK family protein [Acidimicrobiales bacterium]
MTSVVTDAWRTIVPGPDDRNGPLAPLLLSLTVVTGLVDAFSYLALGHVFVANMTGNVVFLAFALAGAGGFSLLASLAALAAFSVGALVGGRLSASFGGHRGRLLLLVSALEALLVATATVVVALVGHPGTGAARYVLIALLSLSMGAQNAMARTLAVPDLTTTVLTLTITGISADSRLAGGGGSKAGRRLVSALSMFVGALTGASLVLRVSRAAAILVALAVLCAIAVAAAWLSRSDRSWVHPPT